MRLIERVELARRRTSFCVTCRLRIKKGFPRMVFDDGRFGCHKCFEKVLENHKHYLRDYLLLALPRIETYIDKLKASMNKELIIDMLEDEN